MSDLLLDILTSVARSVNIEATLLIAKSVFAASSEEYFVSCNKRFKYEMAQPNQRVKLTE
jgi:hypothetical protein